MKKLAIGLLLLSPSLSQAETVTGTVEAISFCEYASNDVVNLIKLDDNWYRGEASGTGAISVRLTLHEWWLSAPLAAIMSDKTMTISYSPVSETYCGKTITGRFDYSSSYGEVQINR